MIDSDLGVLLLASGSLAFTSISIAYFFRGIVRPKVLSWTAGLLAMAGAAFLGRWYIGFSRPAGDLWEAACLIVAMMFGLAALGVWIWRIVEDFRGS